MSACIKIEMSIRDKDILISALKEFGFIVNESQKTWSMYNNRVSVDFTANVYGNSVGFLKNLQGAYEIVGDDMWEIMKNKTFYNTISQKCSEIEVRQECENNGFQISELYKDNDGNLHIQATGY
jgi:hypothetical protein